MQTAHGTHGRAHRKTGHPILAMALALVVAALVPFLAGCGVRQDDQGAIGAQAPAYTTVTPGTLTVVSDLANPPFDYMDDATTPAGYEVELMQALAAKMGLTCEYLPPQKFDSIIPMIRQGGKADVGASNLTITDERLQEVDFTNPYIDSNLGIVTPAGASDAVARDYQSLNVPSATIAVQSGTTADQWARENLPNAQIVALDDAIAALTGVQSGLYTATIADLPVMRYECMNSFTDLRIALQVPTGEQFGLVVSKDNPSLTAALNDALQQCRDDGTIDALDKKWFGGASSSDVATLSTGDDAIDSSGAGSITVGKATARPNEEGGDSIIGGIDTRLTWEGTVHVADGVSSVTLQLPEGSSLEHASTRVTVLSGLDRLEVPTTVSVEGSTLTVTFDTPVQDGSLLRIEATNMRFPSGGGDFAVSGGYETAMGLAGVIPASPSIHTIAITPLQATVTWLDDQAWVAAWNSVPFLGTFLKPQILVTSFARLFPGWLLCLVLVLCAYPCAILLGLVFALMRISRHAVLRGLSSLYVNVLRGTPFFLQIYLMFFGLPMMGVNIDNVVLGVIVVAINSSAYQAEIYRAGIQSIPDGQYEAASSLGMSPLQTMVWVILPQTIRRVIPTVTSDFITSYKDTSLLSSVGVMELMMFAKNISNTTGNITPYIAAAIYYLIVTLPLIKLVSSVERRMATAERGGGDRPAVEEGASAPSDAGTAAGVDAGAAAESDRARASAGRPSALRSLLAPLGPHVVTDGGTNDAL